MDPQHRLLKRSYSADEPPLCYWAFVPRSQCPTTALVLVHGGARNAGGLFRAFIPLAMDLGIPLIIPNFSSSEYVGYQRLAGAAGPLSASAALDGVLDDADRALGLRTDKVDLFGFSGGAQFAHRHALYFPDRIRRLVVASGGYYTYLSESRRFPRGIGASRLSGGAHARVRQFLGLPLRVLVGDGELEPTGGQDSELVPCPRATTRLTRALDWIDHIDSTATEIGIPTQASFDVLPNTNHSFTAALHRGGLVTRVGEFLHGCPDSLSSTAAGHNGVGV